MSNKSVAKIFKAIGNERRLLILKNLFTKKELTVGEISKLIELSFKSTSRHLTVLSDANLVAVKQINLNRYYSLDFKNIKEFIPFLKNDN